MKSQTICPTHITQHRDARTIPAIRKEFPSVLLIHPPFTSYRNSNYSDVWEPMGLLFLAGYLRERGIQVNVLDFLNKQTHKEGEYYWQGNREEEIAAEILRNMSPVVGISSMFSVHCHGVHRVAAIIKKTVPQALVVVGGAHASAFPQTIVADENIDIAVIGEGEQTLFDIITRHTRGESLTDIAGIAYLDQTGSLCTTAKRDFMDLKVHPGPARDVLDMNRYAATEYSRTHAMHPRRLSVVTSRGCPYNCVFCSIHSVWRHSYRMRPVKAVLDEIEWLVDEHNVGEIMIWDDNVAANRQHFNALLDGIIGRRLPIRWCTPNGIAIWLLDEKLIDKCRQSGCYKLTFGLETGSEKTQKFIRKTQIDLQRTKELIQYCNSIGIWTLSAFIIGFPFETRDDIMTTINYSVDCGVDVASFFIAVPYPGSELYHIYRENNLLPKDVECTEPDRWIGSIVEATCDTCHLSSQELDLLLDVARKHFRSHRRRRFLNPFYLPRKIRSWEDFRFVMRMIPQGVRQFLILKN